MLIGSFEQHVMNLHKKLQSLYLCQPDKIKFHESKTLCLHFSLNLHKMSLDCLLTKNIRKEVRILYQSK